MADLTADRSDAQLPGLDVLRALAAVAVLLHHAYGNAYGWRFYPDKNPWSFVSLVHTPVSLLGFPAIWGSGGVPVFFLLSGFCIHYSTARRPTAFRPGKFVARRFFRLYPAYLASMALILAANHFNPNYPTTGRNVAAHLLLVHNLVSPVTFTGIDPPYWSLGVEWQYYLLYAAGLWAAAGRRVRFGPVTAVAAALALAAAAVATAVLPAQGFRLLLVVGAFNWCLGAWLAERYVAGRPPLVSVRVGAVVGGAVVLAASGSAGRVFWDMLGWAVFAAAVLDAWVRRGTRLAVRPVVWLGAVSYSLYLLHFWVLIWIVPTTVSADAQFVIAVAAGGAASVAAAAVGYYAVERPGVALGRRLLGGGRRAESPLSVAAAP